MRWSEFAEAAPELARLGFERFESTQLLMLGTIRKDGSPRITPIEYSVFDGDLIIGGMWQSMKMLDLIRDPRCVIHSTTSDKNGTQGDMKLNGRAVPLESHRMDAYFDHLFEKLGWRPTGETPGHFFTIDITSAAFVRMDPDEKMRILKWPGPAVWVERPADQ